MKSTFSILVLAAALVWPVPLFAAVPVSSSALLQPFVDRHELAGAVALVVDRDKVLSVETVGFADIAGHRTMKPDAMFWIASQTKPMTATALMMLVDEGKVALDDAVEKYLPEFHGQMVVVEKDDAHTLLRKPAHPITIREVLSHMSGLPFQSALETPTYLSEAAFKELTKRQTPASVKESYGLCLAVGPDWFGHGGAQATNMEIRPAKGLAIIWMVHHAGFAGEGGKAQGVFRNWALERFGK